MANISSITLPGGGTYDLKDKNAVPKHGMGKNLLDNWYFVGGGSQLGDGVFPINQRGHTQYDGTAYGIDRWKGATIYGNVQVTSTGLKLTSVANAFFAIDQITQNANQFEGKSVTISCLLASGLFVQGTAVVPSSDSTFIQIVSGILVIGLSKSSGVLASRIRVQNYSTINVVAVKLELGTEQTLCHNEGTDANPVWVLNDVPDYEYELYRCMTSTADPSDTYANKSLATEQQLAYVETGTTASRAYAVGEYFCWNGLLYRAKTAISSGGTFTPGTNCTQVTEGGFNSLKAQTLVRRQTIATSITIGLNEWNIAVAAVSGYQAIGIVGVQFAALPRSAVTLLQFLLDNGTNVVVAAQSTQARTSGIAVNAFVLYAKE